MDQEQIGLYRLLDNMFDKFDEVLKERHVKPAAREVGRVKYVGKGIARVAGLPGVRAEELVLFPGNILGMALNLDADEIGVILFDEKDELKAGAEVRRTGRVMDVPVGEGLIGRVLDATARPLDGVGPVRPAGRSPIETDAPRIMDRSPVTVPLQTGIKVIDALIPIGRGQRELILGDRQTGKTAVALDTIVNQKDKDVVCIYCAIGQRSSSVAKLVEELQERGAMQYSIVVAAAGEDPPGMKFVAPYAATAMGEYFMKKGRDVLVIYDDLTAHANAYRELSLLLRRPPGREAYPGDIFFIHSRLLERSTHLREEYGGGSLTALPIIETEAQNVAAYIPTNLISITDGQIYLSPHLFQLGILPAVDVGKSVSRVGGKTQLPAYLAVSGQLRLSYSQFEEMERFARFSTRLDEETRKILERGRRVREILKQDRYSPLSAPEQATVLLAVNAGILDEVAPDGIGEAEAAIRKALTEKLPEICRRIKDGEKLSDEDKAAVIGMAEGAVRELDKGLDKEEKEVSGREEEPRADD